jgi:hypothetical protein
MNGVQLPHDIEDVISTPAASGGLLAWVLLCLVVVLIIFFWWKKRRPKPIVLELPSQQLLRRLGELRVEEPFDRNAQKLWAFELSLLIRTAAELRWQIPATDRTSDELIMELRKSSTASETTQQSLISMLRQLDQIQFAEFDIESSAARELQQNAARQIEQLVGGTS